LKHPCPLTKNIMAEGILTPRNGSHDVSSLAERRKAARHRCNIQVACRLFGKKSDEMWLGAIQDVSRAGIRLFLDSPVQPGMILELSPRGTKETAIPSSLIIRVRRVTPQGEGVWLVGSSFVKARDEAELEAFLRSSGNSGSRIEKPVKKETKGPRLDPFVHGSAKERRRTPRRTGNQILVRIASLQGTENHGEGWIQDRSAGGICLSTTRPFLRDTKMKIRPVKAPEGTPWIEVVVKSCRRTGARWALGCQWPTSISASLMQFFG
jgi:hypothetical protein